MVGSDGGCGGDIRLRPQFDLKHSIPQLAVALVLWPPIAEGDMRSALVRFEDR